MRLLKILPILFMAIICGFSAEAQTPPAPPSSDLGVYQVADVVADVTADSAVHARDQAIMQAQRSAYEQLLQRLGADSSAAAKLSDDDIDAMVQHFEVQNERTSAVRYIGTFTVQFRPNAVRNVLGSKNATYSDARSKPIVVLPVYINGGHPVLWEETTIWRTAWENGSHGGGLVPIVVPSGGLDDIAVLSTEEAVSGRNASLKGIIEKYQGEGALVAVLNGDPSKPGSELRFEYWHYDSDGDTTTPTQNSLAVPADKNGTMTILTQAVRQARAQLEKDWKQNQKLAKSKPLEEETALEPTAEQASLRLPVAVPIQTLAEWTQIEQQLNRVPHMVRAEIITLTRGMSNVELEYQGTIGEMQTALAQQNLSLSQDPASGEWVLQPMLPRRNY